MLLLGYMVLRVVPPPRTTMNSFINTNTCDIPLSAIHLFKADVLIREFLQISQGVPIKETKQMFFN